VAAREGVLRLVVRGVPSGREGSIVVTGPRDFRRSLHGSGRLAVGAGTYRVTASTVRGSAVLLVPDVRTQLVLVRAGAQTTATVRYRSVAAVVAPGPPPAPVGTPPIVTSVMGTAATAGNYFVWVTVAYRDPECDVIGGTWSNAGEGISDFGAWGRADLMRNNTCSGGAGSLEFARSCLVAVAPAPERVRLIDAHGTVAPTSASPSPAPS
jgi:hypothetical protein